jgi:hypothetical protein
VGVEVRDSNGQRLTDPYRGYFFTDVYDWNQTPPFAPPYKDLVVWDGVTLQPAGTANVGGPLACSVVVRNIGEYPATFTQLYVWVRGPHGENLDSLLGGAETGLTRLNQGDQRQITRTTAHFGNNPGTHVIGASYLSNNDDWINLPPGNAGAVTQLSIGLFNTLGNLSVTISPQPLPFAVDTSFTISAIDRLTGQAPTEKMTVAIYNYNSQGLPQRTAPIPPDGKSPLKVHATFHAGVSINPRTHERSLDKSPNVGINVPGYNPVVVTPGFDFP